MGPSAIRYAGLEERLVAMGLTVVDRGNVVVPSPRLSRSPMRARGTSRRSCRVRRAAPLVEDAVLRERLPLVLGGDHSIACGTMAGLAAGTGQKGGVIWFDAHGDMNTPESSPSGNVHGMPLAAALGSVPDGSRTMG